MENLASQIVNGDGIHSLHEVWSSSSSKQRHKTFQKLIKANHTFAQEFFLSLTASEQAELIMGMQYLARRTWLRLLAPDDAADVIQKLPADEYNSAIALLDAQTGREVTALLAYAEDQAGGLMNSHFFRLRPEMLVEEAIHYLRIQARKTNETVYYAYVLDAEQTLLGVIS